MSENREETCGRIGGPVYMRDGKPCPECGAIDTHEPSSSLRRRIAELEEAQERHLALIRNMTTESVTPEEADELRGQISSLIAEVGTLRQQQCSWATGKHDEQCDMVTGLALQLDEKHGPLMQALDKIAELCGCEHWDYAGQVVRDVEALRDERNGLLKGSLEAVCRQDETNAQLVQLATENNELKEKLKRVCRENVEHTHTIEALQLALNRSTGR